MDWDHNYDYRWRDLLMPYQFILFQIMTRKLGERTFEFDSYLPIQQFLKAAAKSS